MTNYRLRSPKGNSGVDSLMRWRLVGGEGGRREMRSVYVCKTGTTMVNVDVIRLTKFGRKCPRSSHTDELERGLVSEGRIGS